MLIDVEDVALGYEQKMKWNADDDWVWSTNIVHEPLISREEFEHVQNLRQASKRGVLTTPRRKNTYVLSGMISCGVCGRRMNGSWIHERAYYRCQFPKEYALKKGTHPGNVYLREDGVLPALDEWLAAAFTPGNMEKTFEQFMAAAGIEEKVDDGRTAHARQVIADCDRRLAQYRKALDSGADPAVVAGWMADVELEKRKAAGTIDQQKTNSISLSTEEVRELVEQLANIVDILRRTDRETKAKLYKEFGITLLYQPESAKVLVEARPIAVDSVRVGEGTCSRSLPPFLIGELAYAA